jgi:plasmid stabilization system protein ParE
MKKVIELLEEALSDLDSVYADYRFDQRPKRDCKREIEQAIELLQAPPRWETPEQYKERTGEDWPNEAAVYIYGKCYWLDWSVCRYITAKNHHASLCVCATEAGLPPADWKPEGGGK